MRPITVYTTTRIQDFQRLAWFQETLASFYRCTARERHLYHHVVIDDSPPPFSQRLVTLCQDYGIELVRDFCARHRVFYGGLWKYILETCLSPLLLFVPDDTWSIVEQNYLGPAIRAFEQHADLFELLFQSPFSAWQRSVGSPIYYARRFYEIRDGFVETVQATRLYPYPLDAENTLWKTSLSEEYRGVGECLCLNHTLLRLDILREFPMAAPHWLLPQRPGKRILRWWLKKRGSVLITSPAEIEVYFLDHPEINRRYNSGYLNMQTFSYTPDHQPCGIDDLEEFKRVNAVKLLSLPGPASHAPDAPETDRG